MNKILIAVLSSLLLSACASTKLEKLTIPTKHTIGKKHDEFNRLVKQELTPYQLKLLNQYKAQHPNANTLVLEAIKYQEQQNTLKEEQYQKQKQQRHAKSLAKYAQRLENFKVNSKELVLKTQKLDENSLHNIIASDLVISNIKLKSHSISRIPYLSPNNPKIYRIIAKYTYDLDFVDKFAVRTAALDMKLDYQGVEIDNKTENLSLSPRVPHKTYHVTFSIQSAIPISQEELTNITPLYRLHSLTDQNMHEYKLADFKQYKDKLQFRLSKLQNLYDEMKDPKKLNSSLARKWVDYETFSPIIAPKQEKAFFAYLQKNAENNAQK